MPAHWMFGLAALFGVISVVIVALSRRVNKAIEVAALVVVISGLLLSDAWATGWIKAAIGERSVLGRVRVTNIEAIPAEQNPLKVPALTFFYDNAGTGKIRGVSYRFAVAITDGLMPEEKVVQEQNRLVLWSGWQAAMKRRQDVELRPGDPGEYLTIPPSPGDALDIFRRHFDDVISGNKLLYIFLTFKFFDESGRIGITETCSYFSVTPSPHVCGRSRTFAGNE